MPKLDFSVRTDAQWVQQLKQQDAQAVQDLWQMLYVFAWNMAAKQHISADTAHDAAVAAYERLRKRGIAQYGFKCPFPGYCHRIVVNECYRRMQRKTLPEQELSAEIPGDTNIKLPAITPEQARQRIQPCLDQLPDRDRDIIELLYAKALRPEEVAAQKSLERNHVNQLAYRARKKLRICLEALGFKSSADVLEA